MYTAIIWFGVWLWMISGGGLQEPFHLADEPFHHITRDPHRLGPQFVLVEVAMQVAGGQKLFM